MWKKGLLFALLVITAGMLAACGGSGEDDAASQSPGADVIRVVHQLDETDVKQNPQTVAVFDFGTLDTLRALGVEVAAVPKANLPSYLADTYADDKYATTGGLTEPDFEAVARLKPDLIIISGRQSAMYEEFQKIGPTIFMGIDLNRYMDSFRENVLTLAEIFDKETEAKALLADIEADAAALRDKVTTDYAGRKGLVVLTTGGKVSAFGTKSRFGIIHDEFGVEPVDPSIEVTTHGASISFEYIAEKNPDFLFVVDRDNVVGDDASATAREVIENDLVKTTSAWNNGNIVYLNPNYWYLSGGGIESVGKMIEEIADVFE